MDNKVARDLFFVCLVNDVAPVSASTAMIRMIGSLLSPTYNITQHHASNSRPSCVLQVDENRQYSFL